jgi:hypothetical protein
MLSPPAKRKEPCAHSISQNNLSFEPLLSILNWICCLATSISLEWPGQNQELPNLLHFNQM